MNKNRTRILYICFLLSGLSALIYQIAWQRMLMLVFGVSTFSVATILTAYMTGLTLGSWGFGRLADRSRNIARLYGFIEIGIAVTGLAVSFSIPPLMKLYVQLAQSTGSGFYMSMLIRFALALAVFVIPCILIGATVPVMSRLVTRHLGSVGVGFGRFYTINTFGAVLGAALAGFYLIKTIGVSSSIYIAIAGNVLAAFIAIALSGKTETAGEAIPADLDQKLDSGFSERVNTAKVAAIIAALTGLASLGYEVAWTRLIAVYTLNSVYVFAMILTVYLTGLTLGAGIAAWTLKRWTPSLPRTLAIIQFLLAMTCPFVLAFTHQAVDIGYEYQHRSPERIFWLEYLVVFTIVFLPTVLMGMTLPYLVAMVRGGTANPGRTVGNIYAANSVGTILGSATTGLFLIPFLGLRTTLMLFAVMNFAIACYLIQAAREPSEAQSARKWRFVLPVASVAFVIFALLTPYGTQFIRPAALVDAAILYYAEGNCSIAHIAQTRTQKRDYRVLYIDSQSVAGTSDAIITDQKTLAHFPLLLIDKPETALTVGFGTGGTSYSMLQHEITTHCVEIEKKVPQGARFFPEQNHGICNYRSGTNPDIKDYKIIIDDARSWFQVAPEPYDTIVDDLTSIQYRGNGNLYTVECFELIKDKLTDKGLGCAWVPITGINPEPLRILIRSFQKVFPHTSIWYPNNCVNDYIVLIGSPEPLKLDMADISRRLDPEQAKQFGLIAERIAESVSSDLAEIELDNPFKLINCLLLDEEETTAYVGDGRVHTDDKPILDYLTHADVYRDTLGENLMQMLKHRGSHRNMIATYPEGMTERQFDDTFARWELAGEYLLRGHIHKREGLHNQAHNMYMEAYRLVPEDPGTANLAGQAVKPIK